MTIQLLKNNGLRRTLSREVILQALSKAGRPLSHQEVIGRVKKRALDRVTVYRTLDTLQEAGLVHRIQGIDGIWRFGVHGHGLSARNKCGGDHIHFLCSGCSKMSCLPEQRLPWVAAPSGAKIHGKQLVVYGLCVACNAKEKK